jgi:hypothetical protein
MMGLLALQIFIAQGKFLDFSGKRERHDLDHHDVLRNFMARDQRRQIGL